MKRWNYLLILALIAVLGGTFALRGAFGQGTQDAIENIQNQLQGLDQKEALIRSEEEPWKKNLQSDNGRMWLAKNGMGGSPDEVQRDIDYDNAHIAEFEEQLEHIKDQRAALNQELTDERLRRGGGGANAIQVLAGTYGGNCPAQEFSTGRGNVTPKLSEACDGKTTCSYTVDYNVLGDPSVGCAKTYVAEWTCGDSGRVRRAEAAAEAGYGSTVELTCEATRQTSEGTVIDSPMMGDLPLDVCRIFENECGKPAADAYCAGNGYAASSDFSTETVEKTRVIGDSRVCEPPHPCGRISSVTCVQRHGDDVAQ